MIGNSPISNQSNLFKPVLKQIVNPKHPLVLLSKEIPWQELEKEFAKLYSNTGTPSKPIRMMVSLLMLKHIYNLGDETLIPQWIQNPYFQYFSGACEFQWEAPCDPSDLPHFRRRIGQQGIEKILEISIRIQGKEGKSTEVILDTTAQEKNITFPTDVKLSKKIIEKCTKIADKENIQLRQSYKRTVKKLMLDQRFAHHPKRYKQARAAQKKIKTIAGRLIRDINRKLPEEKKSIYTRAFNLFEKVLKQKKEDKNKIYSLHEPEVACIAKGKSHKKFEFGSKVSIAIHPKTNVVLGVVNFKGNPHDSKTLKSALEQSSRLMNTEIENAIVDRGYQGPKNVGQTTIIRPDNGKSKSPYEKLKSRQRFKRRAAIEPVISHIKYDCRMIRNYLKGSIGDEINAMMAGAAFNFRRYLRKAKEKILLSILNWIRNQIFGLNFSCFSVNLSC